MVVLNWQRPNQSGSVSTVLECGRGNCWQWQCVSGFIKNENESRSGITNRSYYHGHHHCRPLHPSPASSSSPSSSSLPSSSSSVGKRHDTFWILWLPKWRFGWEHMWLIPTTRSLYFKFQIKCPTCIHFFPTWRAVVLQGAQHIAASLAYQTPCSQELKPLLSEDEKDAADFSVEPGVYFMKVRLLFKKNENTTNVLLC